jgi:predicted flap endonuclease-1-like 5' DNA nuclease
VREVSAIGGETNHVAGEKQPALASRRLTLGGVLLGARRAMSYPIADVGTDADETKRLRALRIRTSERLLEAAKNPKGRRQLAEETGIAEKRLLSLANCADRMRIKGMGKEYAAILPGVGVDTVKELKYRNPEKLAKAIAELNKKRKLVRFLPPVHLVTRWIEHAKKLPLKITYR